MSNKASGAGEKVCPHCSLTVSSTPVRRGEKPSPGRSRLGVSLRQPRASVLALASPHPLRAGSPVQELGNSMQRCEGRREGLGGWGLQPGRRRAPVGPDRTMEGGLSREGLGTASLRGPGQAQPLHFLPGSG